MKQPKELKVHQWSDSPLPQSELDDMEDFGNQAMSVYVWFIHDGWGEQHRLSLGDFWRLTGHMKVPAFTANGLLWKAYNTYEQAIEAYNAATSHRSDADTGK